MTIRKGEAWGSPGALPEDGVLARSDAEVHAIATAARRSGDPVPPIGLLGGDLCRTLGGRGDAARLHSADAMTFPVDLGAVLVDGRLHWFAAHLVAKSSWWFGRVVVAMNAQFLGSWDVAPRGHPNDGALDVLDGNPSFGQRLQARRRLPLGTHLPHPDIEVVRTNAIQIDLAQATPVVLDGVPIGSARTLSIRVEPDALRCVV